MGKQKFRRYAEDGAEHKKGAHSIVGETMVAVGPKDREIRLEIGEVCVIDGTFTVLRGKMSIGNRVVINGGTWLEDTRNARSEMEKHTMGQHID